MGHVTYIRRLLRMNKNRSFRKTNLIFDSSRSNQMPWYGYTTNSISLYKQIIRIRISAYKVSCFGSISPIFSDVFYKINYKILIAICVWTWGAKLTQTTEYRLRRRKLSLVGVLEQADAEIRIEKVLLYKKVRTAHVFQAWISEKIMLCLLVLSIFPFYYKCSQLPY